MTKKNRRPIKHIPLRTCVGCREVLSKRALIRIVRTAEGVRLDPSGKLNGRGAYLHNSLSCWVQALKGSLAHALKMDFSDQDKQILSEYMVALKNFETKQKSALPLR